MNSDTGQIYKGEIEIEVAKLRGESLVEIPAEQVKAVEGMNRAERRAWAKRQRDRQTLAKRQRANR